MPHLLLNIIQYRYSLLYTPDTRNTQVALVAFLFQVAHPHMFGYIIQHLREHDTPIKRTLQTVIEEHFASASSSRIPYAYLIYAG